MKKNLNVAYLNGAEGMIRKGASGSDSSSGGSGVKWTGHADVEGLKAIGWTDEDIAYYQENGVNWNEEDDKYHKVPEDNIALYGVLTADNIQEYKDIIVYLPKIDTSFVTDASYMFEASMAMISIPYLDTSNVTNMESMFSSCYSLVCVPILDTSNVTNMRFMFYECWGITHTPKFDTSNVTNMESMFSGCFGLKYIPELNTSKVLNVDYICADCSSLNVVSQLDFTNVKSVKDPFLGCNSLRFANIKDLQLSIKFTDSALLEKESLLYMINNEITDKPFTIFMNKRIYDKYANDADILNAWRNHTNVSFSDIN